MLNSFLIDCKFVGMGRKHDFFVFTQPSALHEINYSLLLQFRDGSQWKEAQNSGKVSPYLLAIFKISCYCQMDFMREPCVVEIV